MDIRKLQRAIVDGLEDVKGQNIVVFNTEHLSPLFERVIIASGTSNRQTKALAASVRDAVKSAGGPPPRVEGEVNGEWIIVDCGAAVVHVMQPTFREYYHLEELWGDKPVRMRVGADAPNAAGRAAARKDGASKGAASKPAATNAAKKSAPSKSAPVRPAAAKTASAKRARPQTAGARTASAKAARGKAATKKASGTAAPRADGSKARPAKRPATKKAAPRKGGARTGGSRR